MKCKFFRKILAIAIVVILFLSNSGFAENKIEFDGDYLKTTEGSYKEMSEKKAMLPK